MLKDQVIIILGSNGKIGKSFVETILSNNGKVILSDIKKNNQLFILNKFNKKQYSFFKANISNQKSLNNLFNQVKKKYNKIDAVINCSYPKSKKWGSKIENLDPKYLKEDLNNQLGGAIILSKVAIKYFKKQKYGNLIHMSSIQGITSPKFDHYKNTKMVSPIEYSAIKSGIISITKYLAKYCKKDSIRVNCISPGGIKSDQPNIFLNKYKKDCATKGILDPSDLNGTLIYLLSEQSKYVTGQNIIVDDGWSL